MHSLPIDNLIWIDLEMTGLNPDQDKILEVACIVTDTNLDILAESPSWVVHQSDQILSEMDSWNTSIHTQTGLVERSQKSSLDEVTVEQLVLDFLTPLVKKRTSPMCGNTVCQDRRFLFRYMPRVENYFHYRNFDVSSFKEAAKMWFPDISKGFPKAGVHEALSDIRESIQEMRYYRENLLK